jgi:hypothetical protein
MRYMNLHLTAKPQCMFDNAYLVVIKEVAFLPPNASFLMESLGGESREPISRPRNRME